MRTENSQLYYLMEVLSTARAVKNLFESLESWSGGGAFTSTINLKYAALETNLALIVTILTMAEIDPP